jgi:hypothetical protein
MDDHHLTIDDGLAGNIEDAGNSGEPFDPVMAVAG